MVGDTPATYFLTPQFEPSEVTDHWSGHPHRFWYFENGYGASVIPEIDYYAWHPATYPDQPVPVVPDQYELGVLQLVGLDEERKPFWVLTYATPIADDVLRRLSDEEVQAILYQIGQLPPVERTFQQLSPEEASEVLCIIPDGRLKLKGHRSVGA